MEAVGRQATSTDDQLAFTGPNRQISYLATSALTPHPNNARKHSRTQIRAIAKSIEVFGFTAPILVNKDRYILAGHGRHQAAKLLDLNSVPVIFLDDLTDGQAKAYMLADNKLTDRSTWDDAKVAAQLKELTELVLDFDIEATGFETPEIDFRIQSLEEPDAADQADDFLLAKGPAVSVQGDVWHLGDHRIHCGNAVDPAAYQILMEGQKAVAAFTDPPYNVKVDGHVSGNGSITHREFAMASGEMSGTEYTDFLGSSLTNICTHTTEGALLYACMDWRHMGEMLAAAKVSKCELMNLCVWAKSNGGMGSLYRSRHELIFVFKNGKEPHQNNIQLGRFGRNRTNVWNYPSANNFGRKSSKNGFGLHPTVKPILLVADAIHDSTTRGNVVLDPFLGSGTTVLAAERTGRRCYGIEIDPLYVDTAIDRWQRMSGHVAKHANGETFETLKASRRAAP